MQRWSSINYTSNNHSVDWDLVIVNQVSNYSPRGLPILYPGYSAWVLWRLIHLEERTFRLSNDVVIERFERFPEFPEVLGTHINGHVERQAFRRVRHGFGYTTDGDTGELKMFRCSFMSFGGR